MLALWAVTLLLRLHFAPSYLAVRSFHAWRRLTPVQFRIYALPCLWCLTGIAIFSASHNHFHACRNDAYMMIAPPFVFGLVSLRNTMVTVCAHELARQLCVHHSSSLTVCRYELTPLQACEFGLAFFVSLRNISVLCQRHIDILLQIDCHLLTCTRHHIENELYDLLLSRCGPALIKYICLCSKAVAS